MRPDIYWVRDIAPMRLAIAPRPRAGEWLDDELASWRREGVDVVVSLLEPHEVRDLDLADEASLCAAHGIHFIAFPIVDRGVPTQHAAVATFADTLAAGLLAGRSVVVHCRAGIGRSSLVAACTLTRLAHAPAAAFAMLSRARGMPVPDTDEQARWVEAFARLA